MARPWILVGDAIDHGGSVVAGAFNVRVGGRSVARIGDPVVCSRHGNTTIVTGDTNVPILGKPVARHGDKTACGATLIASQSTTFNE